MSKFLSSASNKQASILKYEWIIEAELYRVGRWKEKIIKLNQCLPETENMVKNNNMHFLGVYEVQYFLRHYPSHWIGK